MRCVGVSVENEVKGEEGGGLSARKKQGTKMTSHLSFGG